jgi:hypothetical protein
VERVRTAAHDLVQRRFLLAEDEARYVAEAEKSAIGR